MKFVSSHWTLALEVIWIVQSEKSNILRPSNDVDLFASKCIVYTYNFNC